MTPYTLPGTHSLPIRRADTDEAYQLDLYIPKGDAPPGGWPILYLLDSPVCFATAYEALRRMARRPDATGVVPMVLAGIASADGQYDVARRERDFGAAGAGAFLNFIADDVMPLVQSRAVIAADQSSLFGHSLGGFFTLWTLCHRPNLFRSYTAVSPSIWSAPGSLFEGAETANIEGRRVAILLGEWEGDLPPWQAALPQADDVRARRARRDMAGAAQRLTQALQVRLGKEDASFTLLPSEDHASIVSAAIPRALRLAKF